MKKLIYIFLALELLLMLWLGVCFAETPYYCLEHGELEQSEIVTLDFNNGRFYYVCKDCAMNFVINNAEQIGLIMKEARYETKNP